MSRPFLKYPNENMVVERYGNPHYSVGVASMQGWKMKSEDYYSVKLRLRNNPNLAYYAMFDGHCGSATAEYLSIHFVSMVESLIDPTDPTQLTEAFMHMDATILTHPDKQLSKSGSTAVVVISKINAHDSYMDLTIASVGDSMCMVVSENVDVDVDDDKNLQDIKFISVPHLPNQPLEQSRIDKAGGFVKQSKLNCIEMLSQY